MSEIKLRVTVANLAPKQGIVLESLAEEGVTGLERSHISNLDQLLIESAIATDFNLT